MKNLLRALQFFRPDSPRILLVFFLILLSTGFNLLKPWPLALIVDCVLGPKPLPAPLAGWMIQGTKLEPLMALVVLILLLHTLQGVLSAIYNFLSIKIGLRGLTRVRNEVFSCLQRISLRFHHGASAGDLIYRASWDTYAFQTLFQQGLVTLTTAALALVCMIVVMTRLSIPLTLVAIATVPPLVFVMKFFGRKMSERTMAAQQADSRVTSLVQQSIASLPLMQSYTREELEARRFGSQTATAQERRLSQHGSELSYWLAITVVFGSSAAATTWLGAQHVLAGKLTVGQLLIFLAYLGQWYEPLNQLSSVGATLASASAGTKRIFEILDAPEEVKDLPNARPVCQRGPDSPASQAKRAEVSASESPHSAFQTRHLLVPLIVRGAIEFDHVSFAYKEGQAVLRDVSFTLGPGESAAIIGPSGVGKTTLLNLLPRFFDPVSGVVRLDGVDLRGLRLKDLRAHIALVLQEPIILPTTIAENIAYGKPGAPPGEIEAAASAANADGFIQKLPLGYQTPVGDGAAGLSVGEKQRINLARAFLKDAPILLLDEPTSALDAESEALVVDSLSKLMRTRTTLMVAHRLTTIGRVDKILSIEGGMLTEVGPPEELRQRQGYYSRVISGQAKLD
jgi:ABC-type multidrug transport system fused ATPase/permease subunit